MARVKAPISGVHPLMRDMQTHLLKARYKTSEGYLKPNKKIIPNIFVTPACVDKAITLGNALFLVLLKKGIETYFADYRGRAFSSPSHDIFEDERKERRFKDIWQPWRETHFDIDGATFGVKIYEMLVQENSIYIDGTYYRFSELTPALKRKEKFHHTWESEREFPSGRLCLMIYSYDGWCYRWKENSGEKLVKKIPEIIRYLQDQVKDLLDVKERLDKEHKEKLKQWEIDRRRWKREEHEALVEKATKQSRKWIDQIIKDWGEAVEVHSFFNAAEEKIQHLDEPIRSQLFERARLAKELIGTIDPLTYLANWKTPREIFPALRKRPYLNFGEGDDIDSF